jgi:hypothetical protein
VLGLAAPAHPDGQTETAVLVDHVQELEPAGVSRGIEPEVHGPHLMGMFSSVTPHGTVRRSGSLALPGSGPLKPLLPPEPLHPLVVHSPAFPPEQAVGHPTPPADVLSGDLAETVSELGLLQIDDLPRMALSAAGLAHHTADLPLGCPGNASAGPQRPCGDAAGSEVSLGEILEHGFFQLGLRQKLLEPSVLLFQLGEPPGLLGLHSPYCCLQRW